MHKLGSSALVTVFCGLGLSGCYQGEWRLGTEVPVSVTTRLHPVRTVETWELSEPGKNAVVSLRATSTQRCRQAMYGKTSRTDTGTFERLGGNWWKGAAIVTGIAGGAGVGIGLGGTIAHLDPKYGGPITYATGGAVAAGGIASCLASISNGSKVRYAFCGILTGLGASILAGGLLSIIPGSSTGTGTGTGTGSGSSATTMTSSSLVDASTFQTILIGGGALVGTSILTGIIGQAWQGNEDRIRTVDSSSTTMWDDQQPESACSAPSLLQARSAMLNIFVDTIPSGPGSAEKPLKVKVQPVGPGAQMVDLSAIRQTLPNCGALTVKVVPDVVYPAFSDDYTPVVGPDFISRAVRPLFTQILPSDGVSLESAATPVKSTQPTKAMLHGNSLETLRQIDRVCSGETAPQPKPPAHHPIVVLQLPPTETPTDPAKVVTAPKTEPAVEEPILTPGLQVVQPSEGHEQDAECSTLAQKTRLHDCELQCGRNWQVSSCLAEFRPCLALSKTASQPLRERALCETNWYDCIEKKGVASSTFRSCTEACADANTPSLCRERKTQRLSP